MSLARLLFGIFRAMERKGPVVICQGQGMVLRTIWKRAKWEQSWCMRNMNKGGRESCQIYCQLFLLCWNPQMLKSPIVETSVLNFILFSLHVIFKYHPYVFDFQKYISRSNLRAGLLQELFIFQIAKGHSRIRCSWRDWLVVAQILFTSSTQLSISQLPTQLDEAIEPGRSKGRKGLHSWINVYYPLNTHIELFCEQEKKNRLRSAIPILKLFVQQQLAYADYRCPKLNLILLPKFLPPRISSTLIIHAFHHSVAENRSLDFFLFLTHTFSPQARAFGSLYYSSFAKITNEPKLAVTINIYAPHTSLEAGCDWARRVC